MHVPIHYVECPRDAMQGWPVPIATSQKVQWLQQLLQVGFHTLDAVSFVSPKAIPQMADSHEVMQQLDVSNTATRLLAIVANERGAADACMYPSIHDIGFPFSISPTFQQRNANSTIAQSWDRVQRIQELAERSNKRVVIYFSMAFGNPYGDVFDADVIHEWIKQMAAIGIQVFSLADTVGQATPQSVQQICQQVVSQWPSLEIGAHLHSHPQHWKPKLQAALDAGCQRIDGAVKGIGGCPMAGDALVGNLDTELVLPELLQQQRLPEYNSAALHEAATTALHIFQASSGSHA